MFRPTRVLVDIAALRHNLGQLKSWTGGAFFCPMIKANAYGHGDVLVGREVESSNPHAAGVALVEEGVALRKAGIKIPLLVFAPFDVEGAHAILEHQLTPVITRFEDLESLEKLKPQAANVHLKMNTGMQRLGFDEGDLPRLKARLKELSFVKVEGVCTHLTHGEDAASAEGPTQKQIRKFTKMAEGFSGHRHVHKSASLAALQELASGMGARPGIGVYGLPHEGHNTGAGLRPVLTWTTAVGTIHQVERGESVGYSARWTAPRPSTIAVLPVGYGDGYMRNLSNRGEALFRGIRVPVVGGVCMDYIFIDLTDAQQEGAAKVGERVVLLGRQGREEISAQDIADKVGTIAYEIVTSISRRVPREAV